MDDVDEAFAELDREVEQIVIEFTTEAMANLREDTPADTGHARANWVPSAGSPWAGVDGVYVRSRVEEGLQVDAYTTAGAAQESGLGAILGYRIKDGDAYIVNNVPYIIGPGSLNDGHSDQAVAGFIEHAVARAIVDVAGRHGYEADVSVVISEGEP